MEKPEYSQERRDAVIKWAAGANSKGVPDPVAAELLWLIQLLTPILMANGIDPRGLQVRKKNDLGR